MQIIDQLDTDLKVDSLINLTKSVSYGFISKRDFYVLSKLIKELINEDLEYIKSNIRSGTIDEFELTDEFVRNGLMYITESGDYVYSKLSFDLDKYALSYADEKYKYNGEKDFVPSVFPQKQGIMVAMVEDDFKGMF